MENTKAQIKLLFGRKVLVIINNFKDFSITFCDFPVQDFICKLKTLFGSGLNNLKWWDGLMVVGLGYSIS